jgi:hypothetical protein
MLTSVGGGMQYRRSVQGRMPLTELETSARTESKRMTNHNTPPEWACPSTAQLSLDCRD